MTAEMGELVAALAKAQTEFATVTRDKTVTVKTKTGGEYSFAYAPLDTILAAVRGPLSANGLALVQLLDDGALVTSLMHSSGAILSGRVDLPQTADIQQLGSAVTYLRRYAIQAVLGIAAEDDDDGNHAAGNTASPAPRSSRGRTSAPAAVPLGSGGNFTAVQWQGPVSKGAAPVDGHLRQTPEGAAFGFIVTGQDGKRIQVLAVGPLADALAIACADSLPTEARVDGDLELIQWEKRQDDGTMKAMPPFRRVIALRIETPEWTLPAVSVAPSAPPDEDGKYADLDSLPF